MTHIQTLIFDLDGTLVHSAPDMHAALNTALGGVGRDPLDLTQVIGFIGNGVETLVTRSLEATGGCDPATHNAALAQFLAAYNEDPSSRTHLYPGVMDRLVALKAQGKRLGICTNKPTQPARQICETLGLTPFFEAIVGAEPGQPKKPDPTPLHNVITMLDAQADCAIYVGDSAVDQATARHADIAFALFAGGYLNTPLQGADPIFTFENWDLDWPEYL